MMEYFELQTIEQTTRTAFDLLQQVAGTTAWREIMNGATPEQRQEIIAEFIKFGKIQLSQRTSIDFERMLLNSELVREVMGSDDAKQAFREAILAKAADLAQRPTNRDHDYSSPLAKAINETLQKAVTAAAEWVVANRQDAIREMVEARLVNDVVELAVRKQALDLVNRLNTPSE